MSAWLLARTARHQAPAEPRGITEVRHAARKTLDDWQVGEVADAVELAVSEMLTNALRYGRTEILALELSMDETWLCLSVADANPAPPYPCGIDDQAEGGRGVFLMAELADAWGFRATGTGKSVFAKFRTRPAPGEADTPPSTTPRRPTGPDPWTPGSLSALDERRGRPWPRSSSRAPTRTDT